MQKAVLLSAQECDLLIYFLREAKLRDEIPMMQRIGEQLKAKIVEVIVVEVKNGN